MNRKQRRINETQEKHLPDTQAQLQQAFALHQGGQLAQAQALYKTILKTEPGHFDALHLSGVIAFQTKNYPKAMELIDAAIKVNPNSADAYLNRGNALKELKAWDAALASYERVIALKPDCAAAYSNRGNIYAELKKWDTALACFERAIALKPDFAGVHFNRGNALTELKVPDAALASYNRAIALKPDFVEAHLNRGSVLQKLKAWDAALASYNRALALKPDYMEAYLNRGNVLKELKAWDAALASYERALALKPDCAAAYYNRGNVFTELKTWDVALAEYDRAVALNPDYAEAYSNRGNIYKEFKALDKACANYDRAIALNPSYPEAHYNKSFSLLMAGDFEHGWEEYEWRWKIDKFPSPKRKFSQPLWLGKEPLAGKTILLYREQGLGDTIQFCRYAPMVANRGARVILEIQKPLINLLAGLSGVTQLVAEGSPLPAFDYNCPLLSLPLAFGTNLGNIPRADKYLTATPAKIEQWQPRLGVGTKPRVGLVWSGSRTHTNDCNRSIAVSDLVRQLPAGFQYVSLQKEINDTDKQTLASHPEILHFGDELEDFSDTAALCELMDVIVSVDTSVVHLAGALGKPIWVLLPFVPDWRWLLDREDSPWYPTVRLYRQEKAGKWDSVFERVKTDLLQIT